MFKKHYFKFQYFYNLLLCTLFWNAVRLIQWIELKPHRVHFIFQYIAVEIGADILFCLVIIQLFIWSEKSKKTIYILPVVFAIPLIGPFAKTFLTHAFKSILWQEGIIREFSFKAIKTDFYYHVMYYIGLSVILYITRLRKNYLWQKEMAIRAEQLAKDTHLKMLRYQINPHFLFNILNSLHALVDENAAVAKKLIVNLSEYYRFTLDKQVQANSIEKEIHIVKKYLEIQKLRFEDELVYTIDIEKKVLEIQIPSFIVHLLVENAIKHGLQNSDEKLQLKISVYKQNCNLYIEVANTGNIKTKTYNDIEKNGTGSGIENISKRLQLFFKKNFSFSLIEKDNWVYAKIEINMPKQ